MLRDVSTAARQWAVAGTRPARDAFARACRALADAVAAQTADEERRCCRCSARHLEAGDWAAIARSAHCRLTAREQLIVLGLALEDSCAGDRARLLVGLPGRPAPPGGCTAADATGPPSSGCAESRPPH